MNSQGDLIPENHDFERIRSRVRQKTESYEQYEFDEHYNDFLKTFFDLAQEFDSLEDFYRICVAVPLEITGFETALYLVTQKEDSLELVCDCVLGVLKVPQKVQDPVKLSRTPYATEDSYLIPIYSKADSSLVKADPVAVQGGTPAAADRKLDTSVLDTNARILGMLEVRPLDELSETDKFFFRKYSNRIGYNLHNRLIALQNIDHIKFIKNLVMDIEHNVIVPNMYFKHLFNQLKKQIHTVEEIKADIESKAVGAATEEDRHRCIHNLAELYINLMDQHQQLLKHHANISLYLESLFRREHFERGKLILRLQSCSIERDIILPQLEYYSRRLHGANIEIERPKNILKEEMQLVVDIGLLSQVYANLFSNAAKYTREIIERDGRRRKAMAYGRELVDNYNGPGKKGVKFNVFTTGPHLTIAEGYRYLEDGIRGKDCSDVPGTGHGLAFIRYVIEMHGGSVGYEPTPYGNNFFFILPLSVTDISPDLVDSGI